MGGSKTAWHEYIWKMRPQHLAAITAIMAAIPLFTPLGIPLRPSFMSQDFYNTIQMKATEAKAQGRRPVFVGGFLTNTISPGRIDNFATMVTQLIRNNYRILWVILDTTSHIEMQNLMRRYKFTDKLPKSDEVIGGPYIYGVDWVITPFLPGDESAMARIAANIWEACGSKDYLGTSFNDLPMMRDLRSFRDVDVTYSKTHAATHEEMFVRQWTSAAFPNIRAVSNKDWNTIAFAYNKYIFGTIGDSRSIAEYEYLVGFPGEERAQLEAQNMTGLTLFVAIILGTLHLSIQKRSRPRAAPVKKEAT